MLQSTRNLLSFSKLHPFPQSFYRSSSVYSSIFITNCKLYTSLLSIYYYHHGLSLDPTLPPRPHFTEVQILSLAGKVYIVTGGNSGVGRELVKILYTKGSTVYVAGRTLTKIESAIKEIKAEVVATQTGQLRSLIVDLGNLSTIVPWVSTFLAKESRLDVLLGSVTTQGHEIHMGTNCLGISFSSLYSLHDANSILVGPYLLTQLLLPILTHTAQSAPKNSIRVVFTCPPI
jgi:hypothetical protein